MYEHGIDQWSLKYYIFCSIVMQQKYVEEYVWQDFSVKSETRPPLNFISTVQLHNIA